MQAVQSAESRRACSPTAVRYQNNGVDICAWARDRGMPLNTSATGALLAHDKVDRYRSFGAFGKPAYQSHVQLRAMLRSKRGDKFANYFARPVVDPDAGELRWTAEVPGTARAWSAMSTEEQAGRALELEVIRSGLLGYAQELRRQGGDGPGGAAAFASLLEQAMKVPAQGDFLYFVGDQPVIAFWGFEDATRGSVDPAAQAPRFAAAPVAASTATPAPAAMPDAARSKRPWWWWWLWLLLGLLLLALLLLLPRGCTPAGGFDAKRVFRGATPPQTSASLPRLASAPGGAALPDTVGPGGATAPHSILPPGPGASGPAMPGPEEPATKDRSQLEPDDRTAGANDDKGSTQPPVPPPRKDDPADQDKADLGDKGKADKGAEQPPPRPDAQSMTLPDGAEAATKLDFLEGPWKSGEGLFDKKTGQPLDLSMKFGKDGRGELAVRRADGSVCSGAVQGRMSSGKLGIQGSDSVPCSDGTSYGAPKIECERERGGQTQCYGVNPDGSRYFMDIARP
jgi:hypothetical protein